MNKQESKRRERKRTPNNQTTTGFRISDELWTVFQPLLLVHVDTHSSGGGMTALGRPRLRELGFTAHIRPWGEEAQAIKREACFKARRWVVARAHSWMNRFRRLLIRWDKKP